MAIKVRNIQSQEVVEIANTGFMSTGEMFVFSKSAPTSRWLTKNPYFALTGKVLATGAYTKYELSFVEGVGYELADQNTKVAKAAKVATPTPTPEPEPVAVAEPEPIAAAMAAASEPTPEPAPAPQPQSVVTYQQQNVSQGQIDQMAQQIAASFMSAFQPKASVDAKAVVDIVNRELDRRASAVKTLQVVSPQGANKVTGVFCQKFEYLVNIVSAGKPLYMYGPAGSGKSYTAKQIAEALGLEYFETSQAMFAHDLKGYGDASGQYVETAFYKAFTKGGLFFLDEVDASAPDALVVMNNAIANKRFDFPVVGNVEAHENFRVIAAGNTRMTGATMAYSARQMQDTSFKNRFFFEVIGYDERIESELSNGDKEIVQFAHDLRKAARETNIMQLCSYRQIEDLARLQTCAENDAHLLRGSVLQEKEIDEIEILYAHLAHQSNRWAKAMKKVMEIVRNEEIW